jgi:predicted FMN-binding regulatory protein PaiB
LPSIIRAYPFATLITYCVSGLEAIHTPFFLNKVDNRDILQGHLSKGNPLWKNLNDKAKVLVIF